MEVTLNDLKELIGCSEGKPSPTVSGPWQIGASYIIRTVTMTLTGKLTAVHPTELVLDNAAWIADSSRWADAVTTGSFNEVEPFANPVIVGRGALIDATVVTFDLPRSQK